MNYSDVMKAVEAHMRKRLHSGMLNGEPVLVSEFPKRPEYLIVSHDVLMDLIRDRDSMSCYNHFDQTYMGMKIATVNGAKSLLVVK